MWPPRGVLEASLDVLVLVALRTCHSFLVLKTAAIMLSFKSLLTVVLLLQTAAAAGYVNAAYYASWKTYAGHTPKKLNYASLSHVFFAFASISANGTV